MSQRPVGPSQLERFGFWVQQLWVRTNGTMRQAAEGYQITLSRNQALFPF
jgi:hypothetical protein